MLFDIRVRVPDGSAVVGDYVGHLVGSHGLALDAAKLELSLFGVDRVSLEATFHVVKDSEMLAGLFDGDYVHNTEGIAGFASDLAVDLDEALLILNNLYCFLASKSISQSVAQQYCQRNALSALVGAGGRPGCVDSAQFVEHPVGRCCYSLLVLLWTSCLQQSLVKPLPFSSAKIYINNK